MREILLIIGLGFVLSTNAQIKVVENNTDCQDIGAVKALLSTTIKMEKCNFEDGAVGYLVLYKDIEFKHLEEWKSFSFLETGNDFETLYKLIIDGFSNPPKDDIVIELPKGTVHLHFEKNMGVISFQFIHFPLNSAVVMGRSPYLTKKQVDKLFGK